MHCAPREDLAAGYMMHTLGRSCWLWAPLLQLRWPCPDPHGRSYICRSSGEMSQYITYRDVVIMPRVYLELSHMSMWQHGPRSEWIDTEPRFPSEFELDPAANLDDLRRRSRQLFLCKVAQATATRPGQRCSSEAT